MTAKTMAEVLAELDAHKPTHAEYAGGWWELACTGCDFANGRRLSHLDWTPHHAHRAEIFAAALSAAGFGLVADAKAEAWGQGFASGKSRAMRAMSDEPGLPLTMPNPYRATP